MHDVPPSLGSFKGCFCTLVPRGMVLSVDQYRTHSLPACWSGHRTQLFNIRIRVLVSHLSPTTLLHTLLSSDLAPISFIDTAPPCPGKLYTEVVAPFNRPVNPYTVLTLDCLDAFTNNLRTNCCPENHSLPASDTLSRLNIIAQTSLEHATCCTINIVETLNRFEVSTVFLDTVDVLHASFLSIGQPSTLLGSCKLLTKRSRLSRRCRLISDSSRSSSRV